MISRLTTYIKGSEGNSIFKLSMYFLILYLVQRLSWNESVILVIYFDKAVKINL